MDCTDLRDIIERLSACSATAAGARVLTHCYYPSFERVAVYVRRERGGYCVTDGGEAAFAAIRHGRDDAAVEAGIAKACGYYDVGSKDGVLIAEVDDREWLDAAILAVANAAAMAAHVANERIARAAVSALVDRIGDSLKRVVPVQHIARHYQVKGKSGIEWPIDFAILHTREPLLVKAVKPHRISITSSYATFGDIAANDNVRCFAVHERPIKDEGAALLRQVARIVPLKALEVQTREVVGSLAIG